MIATVMAVIAMTATQASAQAPAPPAPVKSKYAIERFTLANGLEVAVHHVETAPVVTVQVWYRAGSKDEPRERRGLANLFEYMLGKGSKHVRPDAHGQMITNLGGHVGAPPRRTRRSCPERSPPSTSTSRSASRPIACGTSCSVPR
jgi:hypothetical protein